MELTAMITRHAACSCGQLHLTIEGEPSRIAMCHCLACQRRTGAVISNQARFRREQVTFAGKSTAVDADSRKRQRDDLSIFVRRAALPSSGRTKAFPGHVTVAIGNFADPDFPAPTIAVWEESRHPWISLPPDTPPKRAAKQG